MHRFLAVALLAATLGVASTARAATPATTAPPAPGYVLPDTEVWQLDGDDGYPYQIMVSKPPGPPPAGGYPVLYVLDGNAMFAGFAETRRILSVENSDLSRSIVVGIGYKTDKPYADRRLYDFTGGKPPGGWATFLAGKPYGAWDRFADFLLGKLRSGVAARYPVDRDRQALFGHSLGGLFALHMLFRHPDAFQAVIAASPSLFWADREMEGEERDFAARLRNENTGTVSRLLLVCGDREESGVERWDMEALARRLDPLTGYGLRIQSEVFAGEGHITVPVRAVAPALRFAFLDP